MTNILAIFERDMPGTQYNCCVTYVSMGCHAPKTSVTPLKSLPGLRELRLSGAKMVSTPKM